MVDIESKRIFVSYRRDDDGAYFVPVLSQRLTMRIPRKLDSDSTANWTLIPRESGHPFHANLDSRSVATRG